MFAAIDGLGGSSRVLTLDGCTGRRQGSATDRVAVGKTLLATPSGMDVRTSPSVRWCQPKPQISTGLLGPYPLLLYGASHGKAHGEIKRPHTRASSKSPPGNPKHPRENTISTWDFRSFSPGWGYIHTWIISDGGSCRGLKRNQERVLTGSRGAKPRIQGGSAASLHNLQNTKTINLKPLNPKFPPASLGRTHRICGEDRAGQFWF